MSDYLTLPQIAALVGKHIDTVRYHHRMGYLKTEVVPGAKGLRVRISDARRYAAKYYGKTLTEAVL